MLLDLYSESNKICLLSGVNESNWVLDISSSDPANLLRLQMRGSDDVHGGQIPLIKITMAHNAARWFVCWGMPVFGLTKKPGQERLTAQGSNRRQWVAL